MNVIQFVDALAPPWIGRFVSEYEAACTAIWPLRGEMSGRDVFIGSLSGRRMRRREDLFEPFGALLQFPEYFGGNWNAFNDCIRDLAWLRAKGVILVLFDSAELIDGFRGP